MTAVDIGLIKWSALVAGILIAKLIPRLVTVDYRVLVGLVVVLAAKPVYVFWIKK